MMLLPTLGASRLCLARCLSCLGLLALVFAPTATVAADPFHIGINGGWAPNLDPATVDGWILETGADMPRVGARMDLAQKWGISVSDASITRFCKAGLHPLAFLFNESARHIRPDGKVVEGCQVPRGLWDAVFTKGGDAGGPSAKINPANEWARFVHDFVERYDADGHDDAPGSPRIDYYSLWNEPDWLPWPTRPTDPHTKTLRGWYGHDMADLARFLFVSWTAAKAADPTCKVGLQLCFPETLGFLLDDKAYPAAKYLDFVDFHAYAGPGSDKLVDGEGGLVSVYKGMAAEFDKRGLKRPAFVCTECGHPGDDKLGPASSEAVQRAAVPKVQIVGASLGLIGVCWYGLFDPCWQNMGLIGDTTGLPKDGKGVRFKDGFYAMRTLADLMGRGLADGSLTYARKVDVGAQARAYVFHWRDGRLCYVLWAYDPNGDASRHARVELSLPAGKYARCEWDFSRTGKPAALLAAKGAATSTGAGEPQSFEVGIDPVYLIQYRGAPPSAGEALRPAPPASAASAGAAP